MRAVLVSSFLVVTSACVLVFSSVSLGGGAGDAHVHAVPEAARLVGEGSGLFVGVVAERRRAAAFVTDGKTLDLWMLGRVRDGKATFGLAWGDAQTYLELNRVTVRFRRN